MLMNGRNENRSAMMASTSAATAITDFGFFAGAAGAAGAGAHRYEPFLSPEEGDGALGSIGATGTELALEVAAADRDEK